MCLVLSGSVRHFDVALAWKFTNHDDFALTVRYHSSFNRFKSQSVPLLKTLATSSNHMTTLRDVVHVLYFYVPGRILDKRNFSANIPEGQLEFSTSSFVMGCCFVEERMLTSRVSVVSTRV